MPDKLSIVLKSLSDLFTSGKKKPETGSGIILCCHDADRGFVYGSRKYSQLLDSINERLLKEKVDTLTIAMPFSRFYGDASFGNVVSYNAEFIGCYLRHFLEIRLWGNRDGYRGSLIKLWERILKKNHARIIIGIQPTIEMCIAAHHLGIPTMDLQHGIIGGQSYYGEAHRSGYAQKGWPDRVLCWDNKSADWLTKQPYCPSETQIIGNPWFIRFMNDRDDDPLVSEELTKFRIVTDKLRVLVTLCAGMNIYGDYPEMGMAQSLIEYIQKKGADYHWSIRAHPVQLAGNSGTKLFKQLEQYFGHLPNVEWESCSRAALPVVLRESDAHITLQSAVTIEASWMSVPTALLFENTALLNEWFGDQFREEMASMVTPENESITCWLNNVREKKSRNHTKKQLSDRQLDLFIKEVVRM